MHKTASHATVTAVPVKLPTAVACRSMSYIHCSARSSRPNPTPSVAPIAVDMNILRCRPLRRTFLFIFPFFLNHHFHFPAQLVGRFTLSDLLDKPWSQVSSLLPPGTYLQFLSRIGFSIPTARRFSSNVAINNSRSRAFR